VEQQVAPQPEIDAKKVLVEDVTEEELGDDESSSSSKNSYIPGPGESWMEPVKQ